MKKKTKKHDFDEKTISDIYYTPSNPGAYLGTDKIYKTLQLQGKKVSRSKIKKFLRKQDDYNLQRPVKRKFKRAKVLVSGYLEQFDADLMDMQSLSKDNDDVRYVLIVIDVFSKYLFARTLKNKTAKEVITAFQDIFKIAKPLKIRTDGGAEFTSKQAERFFKEEKIYHHVTLNEVKASIAERVILSLKRMVHRYLMKHRTHKYVDVLQQLIETYNATPHRSLNNVPPKDVNEKNQSELWAYMYLKPYEKKFTSAKYGRRRNYAFKIGQLVRISHLKGVFTRAYDEQWSYEVFKICKRFLLQGISLYNLQDLLGELIKGNFYESELQPVDKDENSLWYIEKIIRKRKRNGKYQGFIKWMGYSNRFNSWIDLDSIKEK